MDYETFLDIEPVFTGSELTDFLASRAVARPVEAARRLEEGWVRAGRAVAVRPDLFAVVNGGRDPSRFQPMSSLVATKMAPDAVVSHHAALDFWGVSYSLWFDAVYSATDPAPPMFYGRMYYRGVRFPQRLIASGDQHFGVVEQTYADGTVRVTTMERTLVDTLADPDYGGSWDEIYPSLNRADSIDVETVATYCELRDGGPALRAKVGFFLDQHRELWGITSGDLDQFRPPSFPGRPYHLDPAPLQRPCFVDAWNLVGTGSGRGTPMGTGLLTPPTRRELGALADATEFLPDRLEKAVRLLALADDIAAHPYLAGRLALAGGTALNMFVLDAPRLSFDLDYNYIGAADRETMTAERPDVEAALADVFIDHGLRVKKRPNLARDHAGGKWDLRYPDAFGGSESLAVDVSYVRRVPLWPPTRLDSHRLGRWHANGVRVFDVHEIAAGKLAALYER